MAAVVAGAAILFGRPVAALATTGALCVSIVDQPAPLRIKLRLFGIDIAAATSVVWLAALTGGRPWLMGPLIAATSAATALVSVYGRRALGIGVTMVLALLFGMATPVPSHAFVFAGGGIAYAVIALALTALTDERTRKLYFGEALLAFSRYVAVKAEIYGPKPDFQALVEAHANLVEKLQAARDMIFTGRATKWVGALIGLLDAFDTVLSADADIETLRRSEHRHLLRRMHALLIDLSQDVKLLVIGGVLPDRSAQMHAIQSEIQRLAKVEAPDVAAFRATAHKLAQTVERLCNLDAPLPEAIELQPFVQVTRTGWKVLRAQMTLASPIARYAIRLTLAMVAGYVVMLIFPDYVHGGWVLLTTALIMRANYSITRKRRDDRVLGNIAGCLFTVLLIRLVPPDGLALCVVLAIATSHAFGTVDYRVTAFAACVSALLQLHFVAPVAQPILLERMLDTLIGAGLAWGFSHVLPSWERRNIPKLLKAVTAADKAYAAQALRRAPPEQTLRLARKQAHDAAANLSMTVRRLSVEPDLDKRFLVRLQELLAANYLLASDLASMRVLFHRRAKELEPEPTDRLLAEAAARVEQAFAAATEPAALSRNESTQAQMALKRRLVHIEHSAARLAALSARANAISSNGDAK